MKKSILLGILGLAASVATSFGQGQIALSNYGNSLTGPLQNVVYGVGAGGTVGAGVNSTYTAGLYFVSQVGNFTADFGPAGANGLPTYSGPGSLTNAPVTGGIDNGDTFGTPGQYAPPTPIQAGLGAGVTVTAFVIAYNGSSFGNATDRGYSAPFTMVTSVGSAFPNLSGNSESDGGFGVAPVPEPSILALSSIGAAALMLIRRKK